MSIAERRRTLDRDIWKLRPFVIQDPSDSEGILYLSEPEFHKYQGICLSNRIPLIIIARNDTNPSLIGRDSDQGSDEGSSDSTSGSSATKSQAKKTFESVSKLKASPTNILKLVGSIHEVGGDLLARLDHRNVDQLYRKYITKVCFWTYGRHSVTRFRQAITFSNRVASILRSSGPMGVVLRLKVSLIALNAYVGDCPLKSTHDLGAFVRLTKDGIPQWLPQPARACIKNKDLNTIRMWASILNTYKGIKGTWKVPDTKTICTPPITHDLSHLTSFSQAFWTTQTFIPKTLLFKLKDFISSIPTEKRYHISPKSGPSGTPSYSSLFILKDAIAWLNHPAGPFSLILRLSNLLGLDYLIEDITQITKYLRTTLPPDLEKFEEYMHLLYHDPESPLNILRKKPYVYLMGDKSPYRKLPLLDRCLALSRTKQWKHTIGSDVQNQLSLALIPYKDVPPLGKVLCLQEAAGKNRIIAINDFFTQQVLKPLHLWLFEICRHFPQDSTFDQEGALYKFVQRTDMCKYFSYDLSSATDLIPTNIYRSILVPLIGVDMASLWIRLLVDKDFQLGSTIKQHSSDSAPTGFTRYTRGQPMGALSSWALMNVAHHIINQYSSFVSVIRDIQVRKHHSPYFNIIEHNSLYRIVLTSDSPLPLEKIDVILPGFTLFLVKALFKSGTLPFTKYITLGDDNVIGDETVANVYFTLVTSVYLIPIKLAKSYVSNTLINFANQTYFNRSNISPIPFKEYLASIGLPARIEFASRITRRFFQRPSIFGLLKYVVNSHTWEVWKKDVSLRRVYEPILPLLYAVTLIKLPSFVPDTDVSVAAEGTYQPTGKFTLIGALICLTDSFYKRVVSQTLISEWYTQMDKPKAAQSPHLRSYILYLIKALLHPYLGDSKVSLSLDNKAVYSLDYYLPAGMTFKGLVRTRRHETIGLDAGLNALLRRSKILKRICLQLRLPDLLDIDQLCIILGELLHDPTIVVVVPIMKRILAVKKLNASVYEFMLTNRKYYNEMLSLLASDEESSDQMILERLKNQTANTLMTATQQYLDLGGSLDFETYSTDTVPSTSETIKTPVLDVPLTTDFGTVDAFLSNLDTSLCTGGTTRPVPTPTISKR